jgi:hypothetical protein
VDDRWSISDGKELRRKRQSGSAAPMISRIGTQPEVPHDLLEMKSMLATREEVWIEAYPQCSAATSCPDRSRQLARALLTIDSGRIAHQRCAMPL